MVVPLRAGVVVDVVVVVGAGTAPTVMVTVPPASIGEFATGDCEMTLPARRSPAVTASVRTATSSPRSDAILLADGAGEADQVGHLR